VEHYRPGRNKGELLHLGALGDDAPLPRVQDRVVLKATFSEPVYPYLLVLNPDGTSELLYPEAEPICCAKEVVVPPSADGYLALDEPGLLGFAVVVSFQALPPFSHWRPRIDANAWKQTEVIHGWSFDGRRCEPLGRERLGRAEHGPKALIEAGAALRDYPGVAAVRALVFPVRPGVLPPDGDKR
jgi:hypothetical protein